MNFAIAVKWVNLIRSLNHPFMLFSMLIVFAVAFGGFALTYIFADDEPFLWRLAAGNVIGSAILGTAVFVIASFFGFNVATVLISGVLTVSPLVLLRRKKYASIFRHDWAKAKGKLQGANIKKFARFFYYAFFLLLFLFFFEQTMYETSQGIFTGGSQNLGDLPFHLGAIFGFVDGNNFPPENPSFAGAKFSYPFIADLFTACFVKLGIGVKDAMFVQNVSWAFSLLVILERFVFKLTSDRLASKIAPFLLFFSGGLGFIWFFSDYWAQGKSFLSFIWQLPGDYTISDEFRWGNSLVTLFLTQRSLLLGMPLTLIVLGVLWKIFSFESRAEHFEKENPDSSPNDEREVSFTIISVLPGLVIGLLAGLLPLIHLHSLAVLFVVCVFLLVIKPSVTRSIQFFIFGICVGLIAIPELIWSITDSATRTGEFFAFHFGWDSGETNFLWFWLKNTGIFIPLSAAGIYLVYSAQKNLTNVETGKREAKKKKHKDDQVSAHYSGALLFFYLPFAFLFVISNVVKLAPWEWDNIKVLIYWYVGSIPFVAIAVAWVWRKGREWKFLAAVCFIVLTFSGALDVWRTVSGQIKTKVFEADSLLVAERIKQQTEPNALFLNMPTYNTAIVLSGRRSLMRYPGHLGSHGIDYREREADVKRIYQGSADALLNKYGVDYILISPEERNALGANEQYFKKYPVAAEAGAYKVYKVR